ncbi:MAG TPA: gamma-glutamylcyclotransferase [Salinisphaeraceae bacterium]|nr:gamma-glutamylcyclotransferase [Salinisphaeraceae bacterium]
MNHSNTRTPAPLPAGITREVLEQDGLRAIMRQSQPEVALTDDTTMRASIAATLAARPSEPQAGNGVWLFGYGSLLWNPCVPVAQWEIGRIHGYHRDFRIRLDHGRGSPDAPGLMLGLAPGGSCVGMGMLQREVTQYQAEHGVISPAGGSR